MLSPWRARDSPSSHLRVTMVLPSATEQVDTSQPGRTSHRRAGHIGRVPRTPPSSAAPCAESVTDMHASLLNASFQGSRKHSTRAATVGGRIAPDCRLRNPDNPAGASSLRRPHRRPSTRPRTRLHATATTPARSPISHQAAATGSTSASLPPLTPLSGARGTFLKSNLKSHRGVPHCSGMKSEFWPQTEVQGDSASAGALTDTDGARGPQA